MVLSSFVSSGGGRGKGAAAETNRQLYPYCMTKLRFSGPSDSHTSQILDVAAVLKPKSTPPPRRDASAALVSNIIRGA